MTLEDFFTLTEMKGGLTAPARVKELVSVMQKEQDCIVKNVGDATRQWSTVASTIAATEDKDCLDLFIQLDGLWFIDRWLKDAQKFGNDISDTFVDESITALLCAVEKLHIDYEKSMSYGIWMTVKNLLGHSSSRVRDRASFLFDSWKQDGNSDAVPPDAEKVGSSPTDGIKGCANLAGKGGHQEYSARVVSHSVEGASEGKHVESARNEMMSICSEVFQPERTEDVQTQTSDKEKSFVHEGMKDECSSDPMDSSVMVEPAKEKLSIKEESPLYHSEGTGSNETCSLVVPNQGIEGKLDVPESNAYTDKAKQMQLNIFPNKSSEMGIFSVSSPVEPRPLSIDAAANAHESATELDLQNNIDTKGRDRLKDSPICDMRTVMLEEKSGMDDDESPLHCRSMVVFPCKGHVQNANTSVDSSGNVGKLQKLEDRDTSLSMEDSGEIDGDKENATDESEDQANDSIFLKPAIDGKGPDVDKRSSDLDFDCGIVDALEVARRVAIEVEREVVERREPSCSSPEQILEGGIRQPDSPESVYGKEIQSIETASKEVPTVVNLPVLALPKRERLLSIAKNLDAETENCADLESSQVTEAAQEPEVNAERGLDYFDLNQEVCSEDMDRPVSAISTPISVVSASRAAAAPGLPESPLQFEGAHGWKGSAATSAFRPAPPHIFFEGDKTLVLVGSRSSSKQRHDFLDIDLNVAEAGDDKITDLVPSGLHSGESLVQARPRKPERLKLDLNRISDDDDAPDWRIDGLFFHNRNGHHSPSPSSSSSSMLPTLRNFDLNDQPSFCNDSSDLPPYLGNSSSQSLNTSGGIRSDDSVISIMGARVEVNRKDFIVQTRSLPNGRIVEPALGVNIARSGGVFGMGSAMPYMHPVFGYNDPTTVPKLSFSSAMYGPVGPIPYMVDSRGAPIVPQIVGSASATTPIAYSQPPFVMSMIGAPPISNGAGPSRPNFDLNSGLVMEGGNRESGALRQLFHSGHGRLMDEHLQANPEPSSGSSGFGKRKELDGGWEPYPSSVSGSFGKRKEPDGGWEPYPFSYKHQPPWK